MWQAGATQRGRPLGKGLGRWQLLFTSLQHMLTCGAPWTLAAAAAWMLPWLVDMVSEAAACHQSRQQVGEDRLAVAPRLVLLLRLGSVGLGPLLDRLYELLARKDVASDAAIHSSSCTNRSLLDATETRTMAVKRQMLGGSCTVLKCMHARKVGIPALFPRQLP